MVPNFLPILLGLGLMGALDLSLEMMSMLVGSIKLRLAMGETGHILQSILRYFDDTGSILKVVSKTLHTTGRSMFLVTVALSIGFFVYAQSSLNNLNSFGLITAITIITALLSDILLSPTMMARIYRSQVTKSK